MKNAFKNHLFEIILCFAGTIALIFAFTPIYKFRCVFFNPIECDGLSDKFGQVGDLFGGIANPLITFLALIALLYSIKIQKKELNDTKVALQESAKSQSDQFSAIQKQNFESTFFQFFNNLVATIEKDDNYASQNLNEPISKEFIRVTLEHLQTFRGKEPILNKSGDIEYKAIETDMTVQDLLYDKFHIIRNRIKFPKAFAVTAQFVHSTASDEHAKKFYFNTILSIINEPQVLTIFFYFIQDNFLNTKEIIEKYSLLEKIRLSHYIIDRDILSELISLYAISAYGENPEARDLHKDNS